MKTTPFKIGERLFFCSLALIVSFLFPNSKVSGQPLMTSLTFSNLTVGESYQMQHTFAWYWTNIPPSFTATNTVYTQVVAGGVRNIDYRLAQNPVPVQAFAVAQVVNGSVVGATITDGGYGYVTAPAVLIVRGHGTNATAIASISGSGVVTNITITSSGTEYTNTPIVQIAQPPAVAVSPRAQLLMRLIVPPFVVFGWRLEFTPQMGAAWQNYGTITNTQTDVFITNDCGFFRLAYP
jgi:hypothetical protein